MGWPMFLNHAERYHNFEKRRKAVLLASGQSDFVFSKSRAAYQYVNSGFLMGPIAALAEVFTGMMMYADDQKGLVEYMFAFPKKVTLDYTSGIVISMFQTMPRFIEYNRSAVFNKVTGTVQCFVHDNGPQKGTGPTSHISEFYNTSKARGRNTNLLHNS